MATQPLLQDEAQELQARIVKATIEDKTTRGFKVQVEVHAIIVQDTGYYRGKFNSGWRAAYNHKIVAAMHQDVDIKDLLDTDLGVSIGEHVVNYMTDHSEDLFSIAPDSDRFTLKTVRTESTMAFPCHIPALGAWFLKTDLRLLHVTACRPDSSTAEYFTECNLTQMYLDGAPVMGNSAFCQDFQDEFWDYIRGELCGSMGSLTGLADFPRTIGDYVNTNSGLSIAIPAQVEYNQAKKISKAA